MTSSCDSLFDQALSRYRAGASADEVIADFEAITMQSPRQASGWICPSWLQLLAGVNDAALRSARMGVRLSPQDPQARINLALALLDTDSKGVRDHVEMVQRTLSLAPNLTTNLREPIEDGLRRRSDWQALAKVRTWLGL